MQVLDIEVQRSRTAIARMMAQVVAVNHVAVGIETVRERRVTFQSRSAPDISLPALTHMIVFIDCWIFPEQDEHIGMTPVTKGKACVLSDVLVYRGEPAFRTFPGVEIALKLIGPERAIASSEEKIRSAHGSLEARFRRD